MQQFSLPSPAARQHQLLSPVAGLVAGCFGYCTSSASRSGCHPRQQVTNWLV
eukprot:IDg13764t1